jgi:hypothetical protein
MTGTMAHTISIELLLSRFDGVANRFVRRQQQYL